jgi:hypothetical protein
MPRVLYYNQTKVSLEKHHVMDSVLTKLRRGHMTVYDIEVSHIHSQYHHYISYARADNIPVMLTVNGITRLLIFNREVC